MFSVALSMRRLRVRAASPVPPLLNQNSLHSLNSSPSAFLRSLSASSLPLRLPLLRADREFLSSFQFPALQHFNVGQAISDSRGRENSIAIIYEDERSDEIINYSFRQMEEFSNRLSQSLVRLGLRRTDRVAILLSQSPETAIVHAAIMKCGMISVPLSSQFGSDALEYRLNNCGAAAIFVEPAKVEEILQLQLDGKLPNIKFVIKAEPLDAVKSSGSAAASYSRSAAGLSSSIIDLKYLFSEPRTADFVPVNTLISDPALIIYTSGTTGNPKGALHSHSVLLGHLPGVEMPHEFFPQPNDKFWTPADYAWIGGLLDVLFPSLVNSVPVLAKRFAKFDPELALQLISRHNIRNMFLPPTALKLMRAVEKSKIPPINVRTIGSGGESLGDSLIDWGRETFNVTINEFYGQTECNLMVAGCNALFPRKSGAIGKAVPGASVAIVSDSGMPMATGAEGNIAMKTPHPVQFLQYWDNIPATKEKFVNGYLLTGDIGKVDSEGYFSFVGRSDDVIKSAGYRIGPSEIENCIGRVSSQIQLCVVVGIPDPHDIRGEIVAAVCVLENSHSEEELQALRHLIRSHVQSRLAHYQYPRVIVFVDREQIPFTATGKIIRKQIRKALIEGKINWKNSLQQR